MFTSGRLSPGAKALRLLPAVGLLLCASLLAALEAPSKPFLEKNSFLLSSAGFRVKLANDAAGLKAMRALPAHRLVIHRNGGNVRYLYAEPNHCVRRGISAGLLLTVGEGQRLVIRGLDPCIRQSSEQSCKQDGWPGRARP
jgi:hypothetical protein